MGKRCFFLFIVLLLSPFFSSTSQADEGPLQLITAEEAGAPELPPSAWLFEAARVEGGPLVEVISPQSGSSHKPPVSIKVRFVEKEGKEIDLTTLKVEYLKFLTIDLTSRVREYVTRQGIDVPEAALPSGRHTLRLSIGDITGVITRQVFTVEVLQ